jgi:hypothetical protein
MKRFSICVFYEKALEIDLKFGINLYTRYDRNGALSKKLHCYRKN